MGKLKKCSACGNEISKNAKVCPHCGESNQPKNMGCGTLIIALILLGFFISIFDDNTSSSSSSTTRTVTPKTHSKPEKLVPKKSSEETDKALLEGAIKDLKEFNKFNDYKSLSLEELNTRMQVIRFTSKIISLREDRAKADKNLLPIWKEAKQQQIQVQLKHFPKMRDRLGPLMREKMWEHDIHVKTIGKGFTRIVFTGGYFAANRNIKSTQESIRTMLHDYRFKRVDYKWMKSASEWTYFEIDSKKDNIL